MSSAGRRRPPLSRPTHILLAATVLVLAALATACDRGAPPADASASQLRDWAAERLSAGDLAGATAAYRRALHRDSLDVAALTGLARVYDLQERTDLADRYRERAFHIHYARADELLAAGQADQAEVAFTAATEAMPTHPMGYLRLGQLRRAAGDLEGAIGYYEKAVEADPRLVQALIELGQAYAEAHRFDEAQQAFAQALEHNVNAVDAYLGLGEILAGRGDWAAAAAQYEKVLLINPRSEAARLGLARARAGLQGR